MNVATNNEQRIRVRVDEKILASDGVVFVTLAAVDGSQLPPWTAGAHLDIHLPNGLVRQYSLCGDPRDHTRYTIGVLNAPTSRGGSKYVHEKLNTGDELDIVGPRNNFELVDAPEYLFIAGGIGITPIIAMIREVAETGRPWSLFYGGRTSTSMALVDELAQFGDRVSLWPQDTRGIIDLPAVLSNPRSGVAVYACGPEPLLVAVEKLCDDSWPANTLHLERFAPKSIDSVPNSRFQVELARSGKVIDVPADKSILDALADNGVLVISSCGEGTCGTCETAVLEGDIDHRDSVLTKDEQANMDCMMVCVSRANCPKLVLDL